MLTGERWLQTDTGLVWERCHGDRPESVTAQGSWQVGWTATNSKSRGGTGHLQGAAVACSDALSAGKWHHLVATCVIDI